MTVVSSERRVDVEYISLDSMEAVLWKVRSSSVGSVELYRPVERGSGGGGLDCEFGGAGGSAWHKLKNSVVRSCVAIVDCDEKDAQIQEVAGTGRKEVKNCLLAFFC